MIFGIRKSFNHYFFSLFLFKFFLMDKIRPDEVLNDDEMRAAKDAFDAYDKMGYGTLEVEEL